MKKLALLFLGALLLTSFCQAKTYRFDGVTMWSIYEDKHTESCNASVVMRLEDPIPWIAWNIQNPNTGEWGHCKYLIRSHNRNSDGNIEYYGAHENFPKDYICIVVDERKKGEIAIQFILKSAYYMDFKGPISVTDTPTNVDKLSKEDFARQFVIGMYKEVLPAAANERGDWYVGKYFSERLLDFYSLVNNHDKIYHEDEPGCFNLDLWTQSEVADVKYSPVIKSVRFEEDWQGEEYVDVEVILKSPNPTYYPDSNITIELWETDEGWKIKDYNGIEMKMKSYLSGNHPCIKN